MTTLDLKTLFRTDAQGKPASFSDVIDDGLEGELAGRIPDLLALLRGSEGESSLKAAIMLLSWGHPEAMQALQRWSLQPSSAPWARMSLTQQRHSGADGSWSMLADALRTSRYASERPGLDSDRISALRALLRLTRDEDFDRSLTTTISSISGAATQLADELDAAITALLAAGPSRDFDRLFQASMLCKELARSRLERAQSLAQQIAAQSPSLRAQRELDDLLKGMSQAPSTPDPRAAASRATAMLDGRVQRQLQDGSEWHSPRHIHPHDGLLHALRTDPASRPAYVEALRQRLGSTDRQQRTGAIALLREILPDIGADRALAALHSAPLEPGQRPAWRIEVADLEQAAARALAAGATAADTHTIDWLKRLALQRPYRVFLLAPLARLDPDWLLANAALVEHRNLAALTALPAGRRAELIEALAPWPPEQPSLLTRAFWKKVPPAEAARLRALMWPS